ncbi:hypothetical protein EJ02DRAFT_368470 [Clathrospora elynae]|uniref:Uncharacterized protein n=1 Tax=Clathrospora elynae TaxID=706981 RepID=A0A6A5T1X7_9PLEO|nr:hypothetical protein EJ02DRAFT_368470 [Clathrospora elynae]
MAQPYLGPTALTYSKYASSHQRKAAMAAASSSLVTVTAAGLPDNVIATKQQIAATNTGDRFALDMAQHNADSQLAIAQGNALKAEVDKHGAKLARTVSSVVNNTRQLLQAIRESLPKDGTDLTAVDNLWTELEQLFAAASDAKAALPAFLERQRNNMSLYHSSMMNETMRDTQDELNIQHKKVEIQHNLILEHQEAFQEYKAQADAKLKELEDMQERVSRLTLEKGNFRTEIDNYMQLLEEERSGSADYLRKASSVQEELNVLAASKKVLLVETDTLRRTVEDLQQQMKTSEQLIADRFNAELKASADKLAQETSKTTSLNVVIKTMKGGESTARLEADKVKKENKALSEKYSIQAAEHAKAFTKLNEQTKQLDALNVALTAAKSDAKTSKPEVDGLIKKIENLNKDASSLESENNALRAKQAELNKAVQAVQIVKAENLKLKAAVDEARSTSHAVGGSEEVKQAQEKIESLQESLQEWTDLAKRSYKEYKDMLPTYKEAEQYRKDSLEKDVIIQTLRLAAAKPPQSNGVGGTSSDAGYWKGKYDALLATVSG